MDKRKTNNKLTKEERQQLKCWLSATPLQRLEWLEEAQRIAEKSGALETYRSMLEKGLPDADTPA